MMAVILMRYIVRTFAINNTLLLNQVMLEDNFITSMIKADGNMLAFLSRPIAAALACVTILIWVSPSLLALIRRRQAPPETLKR
tara:strand:- start:873 stop:1124 length:252 start_codon:yes stop_codon:yes gene_type:complete